MNVDKWKIAKDWITRPKDKLSKAEKKKIVSDHYYDPHPDLKYVGIKDTALYKTLKDPAMIGTQLGHDSILEIIDLINAAGVVKKPAQQPNKKSDRYQYESWANPRVERLEQPKILDYIGYHNKKFGNDEKPLTAAEARMGENLEKLNRSEPRTVRKLTKSDPMFTAKKQIIASAPQIMQPIDPATYTPYDPDPILD